MVISARPVSTARLRLDPLRTEDADEMVGVLADPRMYTFTGGAPPELDQLRERYRRLVVGHSDDGTEWWLNWIVRMPGTAPGREVGVGVAVGVVQATVSADGTAAEVAWEVGVPWQGQGFAGEAAAAMVAWLVGVGVDTVTACVHPDHGASAGVATRAGLVATAEVIDGEQVWRRPSGSSGRSA